MGKLVVISPVRDFSSIGLLPERGFFETHRQARIAALKTIQSEVIGSRYADQIFSGFNLANVETLVESADTTSLRMRVHMYIASQIRVYKGQKFLENTDTVKTSILNNLKTDNVFLSSRGLVYSGSQATAPPDESGIRKALDNFTEGLFDAAILSTTSITDAIHARDWSDYTALPSTRLSVENLISLLEKATMESVDAAFSEYKVGIDAEPSDSSIPAACSFFALVDFLTRMLTNAEEWLSVEPDASLPDPETVFAARGSAASRFYSALTSIFAIKVGVNYGIVKASLHNVVDWAGSIPTAAHSPLDVLSKSKQVPPFITAAISLGEEVVSYYSTVLTKRAKLMIGGKQDGQTVNVRAVAPGVFPLSLFAAAVPSLSARERDLTSFLLRTEEVSQLLNTGYDSQIASILTGTSPATVEVPSSVSLSKKSELIRDWNEYVTPAVETIGTMMTVMSKAINDSRRYAPAPPPLDPYLTSLRPFGELTFDPASGRISPLNNRAQYLASSVKGALPIGPNSPAILDAGFNASVAARAEILAMNKTAYSMKYDPMVAEVTHGSYPSDQKITIMPRVFRPGIQDVMIYKFGADHQERLAFHMSLIRRLFGYNLGTSAGVLSPLNALLTPLQRQMIASAYAGGFMIASPDDESLHAELSSLMVKGDAIEEMISDYRLRIIQPFFGAYGFDYTATAALDLCDWRDATYIKEAKLLVAPLVRVYAGSTKPTAVVVSEVESVVLERVVTSGQDLFTVPISRFSDISTALQDTPFFTYSKDGESGFDPGASRAVFGDSRVKTPITSAKIAADIDHLKFDPIVTNRVSHVVKRMIPSQPGVGYEMAYVFAPIGVPAAMTVTPELPEAGATVSPSSFEWIKSADDCAAYIGTTDDRVGQTVLDVCTWNINPSVEMSPLMSLNSLIRPASSYYFGMGEMSNSFTAVDTTEDFGMMANILLPNVKSWTASPAAGTVPYTPYTAGSEASNASSASANESSFVQDALKQYNEALSKAGLTSAQTQLDASKMSAAKTATPISDDLLKEMEAKKIEHKDKLVHDRTATTGTFNSSQSDVSANTDQSAGQGRARRKKRRR